MRKLAAAGLVLLAVLLVGLQLLSQQYSLDLHEDVERLSFGGVDVGPVEPQGHVLFEEIKTHAQKGVVHKASLASMVVPWKWKWGYLSNLQPPLTERQFTDISPADVGATCLDLGFLDERCKERSEKMQRDPPRSPALLRLYTLREMHTLPPTQPYTVLHNLSHVGQWEGCRTEDRALGRGDRVVALFHEGIHPDAAVERRSDGKVFSEVRHRAATCELEDLVNSTCTRRVCRMAAVGSRQFPPRDAARAGTAGTFSARFQPDVVEGVTLDDAVKQTAAGFVYNFFDTKCAEAFTRPFCCLGSFSLAGEPLWVPTACDGANYSRFATFCRNRAMMAGKGSESDCTSHSHVDSLLAGLGNRTLLFIGDSMMTQVAHSLECAWLRQGLAVTLSFTRRLVKDIFDEAGFAPNSKYGANSVWEWRGQHLSTGVHFTVRYCLIYRPSPDMAEMASLVEAADVIVANFALHWLRDESATFSAEVGPVLTMLSAAADMFPDKVILWRETTAQHHLSNAGDFPPSYGSAIKRKLNHLQFELEKHRCFPVETDYTSPLQWQDRAVLAMLASARVPVHFTSMTDLFSHYAELSRAGGQSAAADQATILRREVVKAMLLGDTKLQPGVPRGTFDPVVFFSRARQRGQAGPWFSRGRMPQAQPPPNSTRAGLYWLPLFRLTLELWDSHPFIGKRGAFDCTHFCNLPSLWEPVYQGIADAVAHSAREKR